MRRRCSRGARLTPQPRRSPDGVPRDRRPTVRLDPPPPRPARRDDATTAPEIGARAPTRVFRDDDIGICGRSRRRTAPPVVEGASSGWRCRRRHTAIPRRHDVARLRLLANGADGWDDLGPAFADGATPGSREWSGSAIRRGDGSVSIFYTAAGRPGEDRPSYVQRVIEARPDARRRQRPHRPRGSRRAPRDPPRPWAGLSAGQRARAGTRPHQGLPATRAGSGTRPTAASICSSPPPSPPRAASWARSRSRPRSAGAGRSCRPAGEPMGSTTSSSARTSWSTSRATTSSSSRSANRSIRRGRPRQGCIRLRRLQPHRALRAAQRLGARHPQSVRRARSGVRMVGAARSARDELRELPNGRWRGHEARRRRRGACALRGHYRPGPPARTRRRDHGDRGACGHGLAPLVRSVKLGSCSHQPMARGRLGGVLERLLRVQRSRGGGPPAVLADHGLHQQLGERLVASGGSPAEDALGAEDAVGRGPRAQETAVVVALELAACASRT